VSGSSTARGSGALVRRRRVASTPHSSITAGFPGVVEWARALACVGVLDGERSGRRTTSSTRSRHELVRRTPEQPGRVLLRCVARRGDDLVDRPLTIGSRSCSRSWGAAHPGIVTHRPTGSAFSPADCRTRGVMVKRSTPLRRRSARWRVAQGETVKTLDLVVLAVELGTAGGGLAVNLHSCRAPTDVRGCGTSVQAHRRAARVARPRSCSHARIGPTGSGARASGARGGDRARTVQASRRYPVGSRCASLACASTRRTRRPTPTHRGRQAMLPRGGAARGCGGDRSARRPGWHAVEACGQPVTWSSTMCRWRRGGARIDALVGRCRLAVSMNVGGNPDRSIARGRCGGRRDVGPSASRAAVPPV